MAVAFSRQWITHVLSIVALGSGSRSDKLKKAAAKKYFIISLSFYSKYRKLCMTFTADLPTAGSL